MIAQTVRDTYYLTIRALREVIRQPAFEVQNYFIPLFFFFVTVGAIGNVSGRAFGVTNYEAFQMPVAVSRVLPAAPASPRWPWSPTSNAVTSTNCC